MNERRFKALAASAACLITLSGVARADPTPTQKATAETLFQSGVTLAQEGRLAEACAQFDASLQIDPALGTLFRLADCYDRVGRTASAWALFSEAKARARAAEQADRERIANERVANLAPRLSKLSLNVTASESLPGLELRLNGVLVPRASWQLELPVDPGPQQLRLSAPAHRTWAGTVVVAGAARTIHFTLPKLLAADAEPKPPSSAPLSTTSTRAGASAPYPGWLGYAVGGVGLLGLGVAGGMAYRAYDLNQQSLDECSSENANACTEHGHSLRQDAQQAAGISTAFAIGGGALLAGGITLILLRPSQREGQVGSLRLATQVSQNGVSAGLLGAW